jgi:hypothetical protein
MMFWNLKHEMTSEVVQEEDLAIDYQIHDMVAS